MEEVSTHEEVHSHSLRIIRRGNSLWRRNIKEFVGTGYYGKGIMVLNERERLSFVEEITSEHEIEEGAIHVSAGRDV